MKKSRKQTIVFKNAPKIIGNYTIVGQKEGNSNFKNYFDYVLKNDLFGEKTFENAERKMLICVVKKRQSALLKQIIRDVDPDAFMYINKAKEVNGSGFRSGN